MIEGYLPALAARFVPGMGSAPEAQQARAEALYNQALTYDERLARLRESEQLAQDDPGSLKLWRAGQGLAAGTLLSLLGLKGADYAAKVTGSAQDARLQSRIGDLSASLQHAIRQRPGILGRLERKVVQETGLPVPSGTPLQNLLRGPLQAVHGSSETGLRRLGALVREAGLEEGLRFFGRGADPALFKGWRSATHPEWSTAHKLFQGLDRGAQGLRRLVSRPALRLALGITGAGLGAGLGWRYALKELEEQAPLSDEEALGMLREADRQTAVTRGLGRLPLLGQMEGVNRELSLLKDMAPTHAQVLGNLGGVMDAADARILAQDPELVATLL